MDDAVNLLNEQGNLAQKQGHFQIAGKLFSQALKLDPDNSILNFNLGNAFARQQKYLAAIKWYRRAVALKPDYQKARVNLSSALSNLGRLKEALEINPHNTAARLRHIFYLKSICAWQELDRTLTPPLCDQTPFFNIITDPNPAHNFQVARNWSRSIQKETAGLSVKLPPRIKNNRITIGYVSDGFRDFPTGHKITGLLRHHNKQLFKIILFSYGTDDHSIYRRLAQNYSDEFIDLQGVNSLQFAQTIANERVDILVDLKGHTQHGKLDVFSLRPAPVQIAWLGFPGTTGASFIDYIVTDKIVTPRHELKYYTERPIYMPHTYQIYDFGSKVPLKKKINKTFTFCSFNQSYKTEPPVFKVWMNILKRVPESRLWLWAEGHAPKNLRLQSLQLGVNPSRILFAGKLPPDQHLARLSRADLALDTTPVNGHTTTLECLWAGVPVVTTLGTHFASRVSASILTSAGLPQLITKNLKSYEDLAVNLATHPQKLPQVSKSSALFDTKQFTLDLEQAYLSING
ncbi:hypothetical protein A2899_03505 [Candidatus Amesbacteria bacterium RIFCSPLOWO2_01_FULL_49_25]|uniref:protein O-GlcNAc transferase n=1 Tax=Candidatus Amesbacteria bacterium RIFCSPHIGHO2_01_FULL_48_32b TaxID=1797253 RepID=A0A1F4YEE5_9BACT|nr:MAG: hypothetical protein A2876_02155 [Candidatus Amesbacteria bacterium RIFCSPHIGHO2_01_FULL_48_32b]OGD06936.1 MAG: hypothetical protein A2899_03505 [Candidatus Amesbacteria bacterium RIFCSPLOWO2_01_FULL_49_25]